MAPKRNQAKKNTSYSNKQNSDKETQIEVKPDSIDPNITLDSIGGLEDVIDVLRDMIYLPILYPDVVEQFKIKSPRGVIFHGPPGTGKTMIARAIVNELSRLDKPVSFFHRKGAECLSQWIGQSESSIRKLFEKAEELQPSIIFFDEIDGLAPCRNGRQDQAHNSIVSTLLTVMDGVEARGQVIVIATTNRLEALDPALRRPGRFDRELFFPMPSLDARKSIISLHTSGWGLPRNIVHNVGKSCVGFSGADIKGLCCETSIIAFHRCNPNIYDDARKRRKKSFMTSAKQICVGEEDFRKAMTKIKPCNVRSAGHDSMPLSKGERIVLGTAKDNCVKMIKRKRHLYRNRIILCGDGENGQTSVAKCILHELDDWTWILVNWRTLSMFNNITPEQACCRLFAEAYLKKPAIVFISDIDRIFEVGTRMLRETIVQRIHMDTVSTDMAVMATVSVEYPTLHGSIKCLFEQDYLEIIAMKHPTSSQIEKYIYTSMCDFFKASNGIRKRDQEGRQRHGDHENSQSFHKCFEKCMKVARSYDELTLSELACIRNRIMRIRDTNILENMKNDQIKRLFVEALTSKFNSDQKQ